MKRMLSVSLALVFFCFVADSLACSNDNPNCQVTTGVIVVNKNTASNDNTVSNDNRIDIKGDDYEVPIPSIPIINFGPGLSGTGSMIDFWAYPGVFDLNGARTEIVPFRNVSIQWIRGTGFFKRRLPDGVVYYRKLWTITYNGQRDRHVMKADEAEVVFKAALMKAQKVASEASELLMVTVQTGDPQIAGSSAIIGGTAGDSSWAGGSGVGSWSALENKHPEFGVHVFEKMINLSENDIPDSHTKLVSHASDEKISEDPCSETRERIDKRAKAIRECHKLGLVNLVRRLEYQKDLYRIRECDYSNRWVDEVFNNARAMADNFDVLSRDKQDEYRKAVYLWVAHAQYLRQDSGSMKRNLQRASVPQMTVEQMVNWVAQQTGATTEPLDPAKDLKDESKEKFETTQNTSAPQPCLTEV